MFLGDIVVPCSAPEIRTEKRATGVELVRTSAVLLLGCRGELTRENACSVSWPDTCCSRTAASCLRWPDVDICRYVGCSIQSPHAYAEENQYAAAVHVALDFKGSGSNRTLGMAEPESHRWGVHVLMVNEKKPCVSLSNVQRLIVP